MNVMRNTINCSSIKNAVFKISKAKFGDFASQATTGRATTRATAYGFYTSQNKFTVFNSPGKNQQMKINPKNIENNKDFPNNNARLNLLKGKF